MPVALTPIFLKRALWCAGLFFAALGMSPSIAASGFVKGQVEFIRTHDAGQNPAWAPPRFWFSLKGVTHAGSCAGWVNGAILFVANDKQELGLVLAAQASGLEIAVAFDDAMLVNSWCAVNYITIGNPAPLY